MTRILAIEDDAITAKEIVTELSSHGLEVDWVDNGRDGLARAVSGDYDLITLDRMLPEMDGLTIVTHLRAQGISTPILMISALSDVDERVRGLRAGGMTICQSPSRRMKWPRASRCCYGAATRSVPPRRYCRLPTWN